MDGSPKRSNTGNYYLGTEAMHNIDEEDTRMQNTSQAPPTANESIEKVRTSVGRYDQVNSPMNVLFTEDNAALVRENGVADTQASPRALRLKM